MTNKRVASHQRVVESTRATAASAPGPSPATSRRVGRPRAAGNRAQSRHIQAKLQVGPAGDAFEREADRIAGDVVARLNRPAARSETPGAMPTPTLQRSTGAGDGGFAAPEHVVDGIEAARGGGQPLAGRHLQRMQEAFRSDFSGVRIHTDRQADHLARSIDARAFTTGNDVFFRAGEFRPDTPDGQHILAHELTHTLQQGTSLQRTIQRFAIHENPPKLSEADEMRAAGSGQTGAFLLKKGGDGLAVKFHADNPGRVLLAEQVMTDVGVATPNTRAFPGPTLYSELLSAWYKLSGKLSQGQQKGGWELLETFGEQPWGLVMTMNKGKTLGDHAKAKSSDSAEQDQVLLDMWSDPGMLIGLGEIVAIDAFLGNADRLSMITFQNDKSRDAWMNSGNWMTYVEQEKTRVETLDNDAMLGAFDEMTGGKTVKDIRMWVAKNIQGDARLSKQHGRQIASIETLFEPQQFIDQLQAFFNKGFGVPKIMKNLSWNITGRYLKYGIDQARERIMANLDQYMGMMSNLHAQHGSDGAFDKQAMQDRIDYLKMRDAGATEAEALESLEVGALGHTGVLATMLADLLVIDPTWEQIATEPRKGGLLKRAKRKLGKDASAQTTQALAGIDAKFQSGDLSKVKLKDIDEVLAIARADKGDEYVTGQLITKAQILRGLKHEQMRATALSKAAKQLQRVTAKLGDDGKAGELAAQTAGAAQGIMASRDPSKPLLGDQVEPLFSRFTTNARAATAYVPARNAVTQGFGGFSQSAREFNQEWVKLAQAQARRAMAARNGGGRRRRLVNA